MKLSDFKWNIQEHTHLLQVKALFHLVWRSSRCMDLKNEQITWVNISYLVRYTKLKARVSAFYTNFRNKISNDVFYHEDFLFVNYIMTGIDRKHTGLDGLEYNLTSKISLSAAGALGEYFHSSRPVLQFSRDNSAADL